MTGKAALKEQWRWTEFAAEKWDWRKIIQRTPGWRERAKAAAAAYAAQCEANRAARGDAVAGGAAPQVHAPRGGGRASQARAAGNGRYATAAPPTNVGNNTRDARAARRAAREQADQQQGGYWN